jgi:restriction endonuclease Mrr
MWDYLVPDILMSSEIENELNIAISLGCGKPIEDINARISLANYYAMRSEQSKRNLLLTEAVTLTKKYLQRFPHDIDALTILRETFSMLGDQNGVVSTELQISRTRSILNSGLGISINKLPDVVEKFPQRLTGIELEEKVRRLLIVMGLNATTTKASGDGGIDVIAYSNTPIYSGKYIVQCKDWTNPVGEPLVRDLFGVVISEGANKGILITTGKFTNAAYKFSEGKPIELIDGEELSRLLNKEEIV